MNILFIILNSLDMCPRLLQSSLWSNIAGGKHPVCTEWPLWNVLRDLAFALQLKMATALLDLYPISLFKDKLASFLVIAPRWINSWKLTDNLVRFSLWDSAQIKIVAASVHMCNNKLNYNSFHVKHTFMIYEKRYLKSWRIFPAWVK